MYHRRTQTYYIQVYLPDPSPLDPHSAPALAWTEAYALGSAVLLRAARLSRVGLLVQVYRVQDGALLTCLSPHAPGLWKAPLAAGLSYLLRAVLVDLPDLLTTLRLSLARRIAPLPAVSVTEDLLGTEPRQCPPGLPARMCGVTCRTCYEEVR
jgi:hypothetical protein